ncbi:adenosylcobinamide-GDP ribazoletransferase [Neobacillus bataviensis]|uniref:adenosylcobinamide-GDP ribazoletransferase n=1 Tax=Neobacillus bataviensis TaxID=220685 RepID=UPI001CBFEA75|nr:adenosylcobinamide-GDP ribazoletransferase [Neobacillus bataviensis]
MKAFLAALMFLTRIPIPKIEVSNTDWKKSPVYFPLIGLLIGGLLCLAMLGFGKLFLAPVNAFLIVLVWIWITGGLHIDGWMDLADGLGSNRSREQMLEIMKDSRVGAMGVIAAICLIAGKIVAVYEVVEIHEPLILVLSPWMARFLLICAIKFWPYRNESGLGSGLSAFLSYPIMLIHLILILLISYWAAGLNGIMLLFMTSLLTLLFILNIYRKLNMLTGDCYGAIVEWSECVSLFLALAIGRLME